MTAIGRSAWLYVGMIVSPYRGGYLTLPTGSRSNLAQANEKADRYFNID